MLHFVATFLDPTLTTEFTFVRSLADRHGFLKQVKECLLSMAKESTASAADVIQTPPNSIAPATNQTTDVNATALPLNN